MNYANEIKSRLTAKDVFSHYGFEPNRTGNICCPIHFEKTPSLKIYDNDRGWHCYGCGQGGSIIDFVMIYFGLTFQQAIEKINQDFMLGLPLGQRLTLRQKREMEASDKKRKAQQKERQKQLDELTEAYENAFKRWQTFDTNRREYAPTSPSEPLHPLYVQAVKYIDMASYNLDTAEMRLREFELKRPNYNNI